MTVPLSILDLAFIRDGGDARESFAASVQLAQLAQDRGYERVWYAEHHNMASIASSATSVLIAHVAAHTTTIRLGAGGVMLPNHSPLAIAEQFGTLETLHPGRIDLGLGRAPGSDQKTMYALRRDASSADRFPQDVLELQAYLAGNTRVPGVNAIPGTGTNVPLYILGSSLFGARLAAQFGLPYAIASHFAPDLLTEAVSLYRDKFIPSEQCETPYVIAGVNAIAADTTARAHELLDDALRRRVVQLVARGQGLGERIFTPDEVELLVSSPAGQQARNMLRYTAVGTADEVKSYLDEFAVHAQADELMIVSHANTIGDRLHTYSLIADVCH